jgi:hypothetical protein
MARPIRFAPEVRERAFRMVVEHQGDHESRWAAIGAIAAKLGCSVFAAQATIVLALACLLASAPPRARAAATGEPGIRITRVPPSGAGTDSSGVIDGSVSGVEYASARVVVYAYTNAWYVQPLANHPYTHIGAPGTWRTDTHLGYVYAALLVSNTFRPLTTLGVLPAVGGDVLAVATADVRRKIDFSGHRWVVKTSAAPVGPGPNRFSASAGSVAVDAAGRLHLAIRRRNGHWRCAEVISEESFGYGTYRFYLGSPVDGLDPSIVLGLFTWSDDPAENHREIDAEFTRGPQPDGRDAQYVIQPYDVPGNLFRFSIPPGVPQSVHSFDWQPGQVSFRSVAGTDPNTTNPADLLQTHDFTAGIPEPGGETVHLNLWLWNGQRPTNRMPAEVVVSRFEFVPSGGENEGVPGRR